MTVPERANVICTQAAGLTSSGSLRTQSMYAAMMGDDAVYEHVMTSYPAPQLAGAAISACDACAISERILAASGLQRSAACAAEVRPPGTSSCVMAYLSSPYANPGSAGPSGGGGGWNGGGGGGGEATSDMAAAVRRSLLLHMRYQRALYLSLAVANG